MPLGSASGGLWWPGWEGVAKNCVETYANQPTLIISFWHLFLEEKVLFHYNYTDNMFF